MTPKVWLMPPWGRGEPQEVEATPEILVPRMVEGWAQCAPPDAKNEEVKNDVR
jgi:hypothetical protein